MLSNKIIKLGEYMYRVYPFKSIKQLELGNAYTFGGDGNKFTIMFKYVLPFIGELKKKSTEIGIYVTKDGHIHVIHPRSEKERQNYSISRILLITPDTINKELNEYLEEIDLTDLKYTGKIFTPEIKQSDDVGMKGVRLALIAKQIDFNNYASRYDKSHGKANARKALEKDSTLTFSKLKEYSDIFDLQYGLILFDKHNAKDPMSKKGRAIVVFNDDVYEFNDPNIKIVTTLEEVMKVDDDE